MPEFTGVTIPGNMNDQELVFSPSKQLRYTCGPTGKPLLNLVIRAFPATPDWVDNTATAGGTTWVSTDVTTFGGAVAATMKAMHRIVLRVQVVADGVGAGSIAFRKSGDTDADQAITVTANTSSTRDEIVEVEIINGLIEYKISDNLTTCNVSCIGWYEPACAQAGYENTG